MLDDFFAAEETQTCALARRLARHMASTKQLPATICLDGALGAGKSVFARAFLQALGVTGEIPSPTFTLVQHYSAQEHGMEHDIWHLDAYRIAAPQDVEELGILDAFGHATCLIEWPGKIAAFLPTERLDIFMKRAAQDDDAARRITFSGTLAEQITL